MKSATNFMPLFAGAATPERAKRMINEHLLNPHEFWLAYPVASYAKTEPDYYQGSHNECNWRGSTWAPTNYMIFQGLQAYGYHNEARELARAALQHGRAQEPGAARVLQRRDGDGLGQTHFWGFTALYYGMLLESYANYDASSLDKPLRPIIPQELGVQFPGAARRCGRSLVLAPGQDCMSQPSPRATVFDGALHRSGFRWAFVMCVLDRGSRRLCGVVLR